MKYLFRKLSLLAFALFVAVTLNFFIPRMMPGDPATELVDKMQGIPPEALESIKVAFGLKTDDPMIVQYFKYLGNIFKGDLGISLSRFPTPVSTVLALAIPWTLGLIGLSTVLSFFIGTVVGIAVAWNRNKRAASWTVGVFIFIRSFPYFWLGLLLIYLLGFRFEVFPVGGSFSPYVQRPSWDFFVSVLYHGFLPALTIVVSSMGTWILTMRNNMINVLAEDYITVALAKGLSLKRIKTLYAAKNAILPSITGFAMSLGFVVGGGLLTEMVFGYPGVGLMLFQAVQAKDYPLMQAIFLFISTAVLAANFLADLAVLVLDPRARDGGR
ncbi:MAG TPA: ABC transporter permease [Thermotogota bacterium]|nr:ABC transporter permease [Thermotogota bacterium]HRW93687.1 ABC transporter permease [Thermotogota bacterium]